MARPAPNSPLSLSRAHGGDAPPLLRPGPSVACSTSACPTSTASTSPAPSAPTTDLLLIILTARSAEIDVIVGLDAGAGDYLVKPFSLTVLLARLRAHLRRRTRPAADEPTTIELGALSIDLAARRCLLHGDEIALRPKQFDLFAALATRRGTAVSRETLMDEVWDENWYGSTKTLDVTMAALRRRLAYIHSQPATRGGAVPVTVTLREYGYRLENPLSQSIGTRADCRLPRFDTDGGPSTLADLPRRPAARTVSA